MDESLEPDQPTKGVTDPQPGDNSPDPLRGMPLECPLDKGISIRVAVEPSVQSRRSTAKTRDPLRGLPTRETLPRSPAPFEPTERGLTCGAVGTQSYTFRLDEGLGADNLFGQFQ